MAANNKKYNVRVGGSGYTVLHWPGSGDGTPIKLCRTITETMPTPVGGGTADIQPLDAKAPVDIAFSAAATSGTLALEVWEEWDYYVWQRIPNFRNVGIDTSNSDDDDRDDLPEEQDTIVRILKKSAKLARTDGIQCTKIIMNPGKPKSQRRITNYFGCVVTNVTMGDGAIAVDTMDIRKTITLKFRYSQTLGNKGPK